MTARDCLEAQVRKPRLVDWPRGEPRCELGLLRIIVP
jgi:hypothetical protein